VSDCYFFFSSRRRHTRCYRDWSSDVCSSDLSVVVLGDESGYLASDNQKMKVAAIEAEWRTEEPPASFTVFGFPDVQARTTHAARSEERRVGKEGRRREKEERNHKRNDEGQ